MTNLNLNGIWQLRKTSTNNVMDTNVSGSALQTLIDNNIMPDPYYRDNEKTAYKFSNDDFEYTKTFFADKTFVNFKNVRLHCEGLDTLCDIYLNNKKIASCKNMYRHYEINIKDYIKSGENTIKIYFHSAVAYLNEKAKTSCWWGLPENSMKKAYQRLRKSHYMFGWDWAPTTPDVGIWRDIYILAYDIKTKDVYFTQKHSNIVQLGINIINSNIADTIIEIESPNGEISSFYERGKEILSIADGETVRAEAMVMNNTSSSRDFAFITVLYKNNAIESIYSTVETVPGNKTKRSVATVNIPVIQKDEVYALKSYLWESLDTIKPIIKPAVIR